MKQRALMYAAATSTALAVRSLVRHVRAFELDGRVALVTGGSRGLGFLIARELLRRGAKVAICARDGDELARAESGLAAPGRQVAAIACDITDAGQTSSLVAEVERRLGPIDVLVNNAGLIQVGPMELMTEADYEAAMATHFWGPLRLIEAVLPHMRQQRAGRIVNITSIGGKLAVPHLLPYSASKFALVGLSEGMRVELAKERVLVTTVVPGLMRTGSPVNALFKGKHREEYAWFAAGDSLRLTSMAADRAARQIVNALRNGEPEVILSLQAKLATRVHAAAPGLTQRLLALVDRVLPGAGTAGTESHRGADSRSPGLVATLTRSTERAARRNNEIAEQHGSRVAKEIDV